MNYKVTVIGAGRMGSALATVLFHKGFATTVWNRTGAKTEGLSRLGLSVAQSVEESVREADIVVVSVSDYSSTTRLSSKRPRSPVRNQPSWKEARVASASFQ
jgi:3-hydroxyisobutyrate dehydrogenase-like beta-hydroxyacid dehydrogenase